MASLTLQSAAWSTFCVQYCAGVQRIDEGQIRTALCSEFDDIGQIAMS